MMKTQNENSGVNVLIVEDSRTQAEYLQHILENAGYHVVLATNGIQALEKIKIERPSIVLTDIVMPEMDGYELCRVIKNDENLKSTPVIIVTQLFDPADLIKGLDAGANNIIIKPYEPKHVISRIISTLQLGDAGSTLEVSFDGKTHHIPANQLQTPAILLSTLDNALKKNTELQEANDLLAAVNEDLQQKLESQQRTNKTLQSSRNTDEKVTEFLSGFQDGPKTQEITRKIREKEDLIGKTESDWLCFFLASIVNSSHDAIIGKTLDGTILSWNRAAERYYGYLAEEVIGKSIKIIIPPELHRHLPLFLQRVANGEIIDRFDTIRVRKDGSRIEVCVTLSPIKDEKGHIIGISTIAQNIADRKKNDVSLATRKQADPHS